MHRGKLQDVFLLDFTSDWWPASRHIKVAFAHFWRQLSHFTFSICWSSPWYLQPGRADGNWLYKDISYLPQHPGVQQDGSQDMYGCQVLLHDPWPLNSAGSSSPTSLRAEAWQNLLVTTSRVVKTCPIHACCHGITYPYYSGPPPVTNVAVKTSTAPDTSCKPVEFWLPLFCLSMPWQSLFIPSLHPVPNLHLHFFVEDVSQPACFIKLASWYVSLFPWGWTILAHGECCSWRSTSFAGILSISETSPMRSHL